jgi:hypothetical protein
MGQRFRLKASFDISDFPPAVQVILTALKRYGMMLADNGSPWFLSGVPDPRWNDDELVTSLRRVPGNAFEAVDVSALMIDANSGQAAPPPPAGSYHLTVTVRGLGAVTSAPAGIDCPMNVCDMPFTEGTTVTLTPSGGRFRYWSGACSGSGPCTVPMTQHRAVTAHFRKE